MWVDLVRIVPVFLVSMVKFFFGPLGGFAAGLSPVTTAAVTVAGMMSSVLIFTFFGEWARAKIAHFFPSKRKRFSPRTRKVATLWKKYGVVGVAALTPPVFTPIGGVIIAVSLGGEKHKILFSMFVSAVAWAIVITAVVYMFGSAALEKLELF